MSAPSNKQLAALLRAAADALEGIPAAPKVRRPTGPLTPAAAATLELLQALPPNKGMIGPKIMDSLAARKIFVDQARLSGRVIPELRQQWPVKNKPRIGYYLEK